MTKTGEAARPPITVDPDSLLDTVQLYRKPLTVAAIVVAVLVGGAFLWQANSARKSARAEKAFFNAFALYSQKDAKAADSLGWVASRYDGTPGGIQAALLLAQTRYDEGKFDDGLKALEAVKRPGVFASGVETLIAAGYEGKQQFDKAAEHYRAAVDKAPLSGEKEYLQGELARALTVAGKKDEARKIWEALAATPDSPMSGEARIRMGELSALPAKN